jgi:hypothetical protein
MSARMAPRPHEFLRLTRVSNPGPLVKPSIDTLAQATTRRSFFAVMPLVHCAVVIRVTRQT